MEDSGIKLFGKKILLTETTKNIDLSAAGGESCGGSDHNQATTTEEKSCLEEERVNTEDEEEKDQLKSENIESDNPTTAGDQPKTPKKPDKILPCPRCNSMDTKFCYYNNYNVKQPRHFCKSCQRYWTAGGTMRNMPVGAGRRKTKNPVSHCRFVTADSDRIRNFPPKVLAFGTRKGPENEDDSACSMNLQSNVYGLSWSYNPRYSGVGYPTILPPYWNAVPWLQNSLILGKHSRETMKPNGLDSGRKKQKGSVLIPKTLRIDDPEEAAKSSIWATLGIENENVNGGLFQGLESKGTETRKHPVLEANPAAFSRSICFRERA